ncbi:hypothetical protein [Mucilaginibacter sp.]|uniref:hypothetical protein n=1 Tax=Mucilaginibacter sp. TaxID=1882438 RepID=UPI00260EB951|nr:hypothetical protein [Mucilaginibacter sp.]MDB5031519.1 hypothetical protein [Mucilaginibacter sp.]
MKERLFYLFLPAVILATGCIKSASTPPPPPIPSGTFSGQFKLYQRHTDRVPYDSLITNITVTLKTPDYTYAVTGDTITLHAGSYGTYGISGPYMIFNDKTSSPTPPYTKSHLSGGYLYNYNGTNLLLYASSSDTLILGYSLKKVTP